MLLHDFPKVIVDSDRSTHLVYIITLSQCYVKELDEVSLW